MTTTRSDFASGKLPHRDIVLLPCLALLTVVAIGLAVWSYAAGHYRASTSTVNTCLIMNDRATGVRGIPNSVCSMKTAESEDVVYRFNDCGDRAGMPCGPKAADVFRIVMIGSSVDFGFDVEREKTFAALLPVELSHLTGRKIEVYNEAMLGGFPYSASLRLDEVLAAKPDLVLWVLAPRDVRNASVVLLSDLAPAARQTGAGAKNHLQQVREIFTGNSVGPAVGILGSRVLGAFQGSVVGIFLQHLLYASQSQYVKSYLMAPESDANVADVGFLRVDRTARWKEHVKIFDDDANRIEKRLVGAGVPVVTTFVPERGQAAMIAMETWPAEFDPYKLADDVGRIVVSHGANYVDILRDYRTVSHPEKDFYLIDGHPDANGHAVIARLLARHLADGRILQLRQSADAAVLPVRTP